MILHSMYIKEWKESVLQHWYALICLWKRVRKRSSYRSGALNRFSLFVYYVIKKCIWLSVDFSILRNLFIEAPSFSLNRVISLMIIIL